MSEKLWNKFHKDIKVIIPNIDSSVLTKLKSTFFEMPDEYYNTRRCTNLLADTLKHITENKLKVYIHLLEFKKILKNTKKMKRKSLKTNTEVEVKKPKLMVDEVVKSIEPEIMMMKIPRISDAPIKTVELVSNIVPIVNEKVQESPLKVNDDAKIEKYISKLENVLQATKDQIEKLEEQELSLDELDSEMSAFVMLDKLKAHYVKVWKKVSKLRNTKCNLRKKYLKSFTFTGSIYPQLNKQVEDFVKLKKFPDYHDIRSLVTVFLNSNSIKLSFQRVSELTVDIFTQIGNRLKKLRIEEFRQYFGNHLTDQVKTENDPMICDENLRRILQKNNIDGEIQMDNIMEKFAKIQQSMDIPSADNESDISTEHSVDSEVDELSENLVENILNLPEYENETETACHLLFPNHMIEIDNSSIVLCKTNDLTTIETSLISFDKSKVANLFEDLQANVDIVKNDNRELVNVCYNGTISPIKDEKPSEEYINEISSTTFRFNVDQMKHGNKGTYYTEIIVLNSDDESDESGDTSSGVIDVDNSHFAYSTKLDDFLITKSKKKRPEIKDIVINLDDDDDDDDDDDVVEIISFPDNLRGNDNVRTSESNNTVNPSDNDIVELAKHNQSVNQRVEHATSNNHSKNMEKSPTKAAKENLQDSAIPAVIEIS